MALILSGSRSRSLSVRIPENMPNELLLLSVTELELNSFFFQLKLCQVLSIEEGELRELYRCVHKPALLCHTIHKVVIGYAVKHTSFQALHD